MKTTMTYTEDFGDGNSNTVCVEITHKDGLTLYEVRERLVEPVLSVAGFSSAIIEDVFGER